jgi:hypothetical protein
MQVWILTTGDLCDPSTILGVYATRELGLIAFNKTQVHLDIAGKVRVDPDGAVHLDNAPNGPDWLSLTPHELGTA